MKKAGLVKEIIFDRAVPPGAGKFIPQTEQIRLHPDSSFSVLFHELMHAEQMKVVPPKVWAKLDANGLGGKEHVAFELTYRLLGKWLRPEEMAVHARRLKAAGVDPGYISPNDPRIQ